MTHKKFDLFLLFSVEEGCHAPVAFNNSYIATRILSKFKLLKENIELLNVGGDSDSGE